jgi:hypothetical protein
VGHVCTTTHSKLLATFLYWSSFQNILQVWFQWRKNTKCMFKFPLVIVVEIVTQILAYLQWVDVNQTQIFMSISVLRIWPCSLAATLLKCHLVSLQQADICWYSSCHTRYKCLCILTTNHTDFRSRWVVSFKFWPLLLWKELLVPSDWFVQAVHKSYCSYNR